MDNNIETRPFYICNCCDRTLADKVVFKEVTFAVNPKSYKDFYKNPSICNKCLDLINEVFNYDFSSFNEGLMDNYNFFKKDGFFSLDEEKPNEDDWIFILGVSASMTEDYHVLYISEKDSTAITNTVNGLKKYAEQPIHSFKDLLR